MIMYLRRFTLPIYDEVEIYEDAWGTNTWIDSSYPCGIFMRKGLEQIRFGRLTLFYGGNGSGKSTLINLIGKRLGLQRSAPFNGGPIFEAYAKKCRYALETGEDGHRVKLPPHSRVITSDDVFDYMLSARTYNADTQEMSRQAGEDWLRTKYRESLQFHGMQDLEKLRDQLHSRSASKRRYVQDKLGKQIPMGSNGETALEFFRLTLQDDTLYCLDEPENSLSAKMQIRLAKMLVDMARGCGCQFVIATHSPFLLAMRGASVYDLDADPVEERNWWELENVRVYYDFFHENASLFERV